MSLLITQNYFENYQLVLQHWKVFRSLVLVLHEIKQVHEILSYYGEELTKKERVEGIV